MNSKAVAIAVHGYNLIAAMFLSKVVLDDTECLNIGKMNDGNSSDDGIKSNDMEAAK